jgi:ribosomal protein L37E
VPQRIYQRLIEQIKWEANMALIKCKECGNEISTKAKECPKCGSPIKKKMTLSQWVFIALFTLAGIAFLNARHNPSKAPQYPVSNATYWDVTSKTGCESKYSDAKKADIFNSEYKNHWFTWKGVVELADASSASLNLDGKGIQDLKVEFANSNAGYNLNKGSVITVKFLMKTSGGCVLPYSGTGGEIL